MPSFFLIELTNQCNLNCVYCFRGEHKQINIDSSILDKILICILNNVKKHNLKNFTIQPWGGEPLLQIDKIIYIRDFFDQHNLHPTITVETNGILLTPNVVLKLIQNDVSFGVSIDGYKEIQDKQRPLTNGNGSYDLLSNNLKEIKEKFPNMKLQCIVVITKESCRNISRIIDTLVKQIGFSYLKINLVKSINNINNLELSNLEIKKVYQTIFFKLNYLIAKGYRISEGNFSIRLSNLYSDHAMDICISRGCHGGYKMVAFDVSGNIYNCELIGNKSQLLGNYNDDIDDIIKKSILSGNTYFNRTLDIKCQQCKYVKFCMGGCSSRRLYTDKMIDNQMCCINKTIYPLIKIGKIFSLPIVKTIQ